MMADVQNPLQRRVRVGISPTSLRHQHPADGGQRGREWMRGRVASLRSESRRAAATCTQMNADFSFLHRRAILGPGIGGRVGKDYDWLCGGTDRAGYWRI